MLRSHPLSRQSRHFSEHRIDILLDHLAAPLWHEVGVAEGVGAGALARQGGGLGDGLIVDGLSDQRCDAVVASYRGAADGADCLA